MQWGDFGQIIWLLALFVVIFLSVNVYRWRERVKTTFADKHLLPFIFPMISSRRFLLKLFLSCAAIFLIIISLMDPLFGQKEVEVKREGIDLVFVLDLSSSMNAQDVAPSRIEKSTKFIADFMNQLGGDRAGLVVFAANAYTISPLTNDYAAIESYLHNVNTELISSQGTDFQNAVQEASKLLSKSANQSKMIVIISDGEDNENSTGNAIELAKDQNIHIVSVGVGTEKGGPIPMYYNGYQDDFKRDRNGNTVISKLESSNLRKLAEQTNGTYIQLNSIQDAISNLAFYKTRLNKNEIATSTTKDMNHIYQWFLGLAILLLFIELLTSEYKFFKKRIK
ncbi:MAG: VWA domain-containing protein [Weeksellaceae bacterium]|nr:VWA domain-containing protein [Weeksellaceae bacterium]